MTRSRPESISPDPLTRLAALPARGKAPASESILVRWVNEAQDKVGVDAGRLSWLIASTVVIAVLQRAVTANGETPFLLKGGTYLQNRLSWAGRATKDIDGIIRGDIDEFVASLDDVLGKPWGPLTLTRGEITIINTPARLIKPRRFDIKLSIQGRVWRKVQVEISPDEGCATVEGEILAGPSLDYFGLPTPERLVGIAVRYQIAQKIHACSDPHNPPHEINDRARDLVDLILLRDLVRVEHTPSTGEIRLACEDLFAARNADAQALDRQLRQWPCTVTAHRHWANDYAYASSNGAVSATIDEAVAQINNWIHEIHGSK